MSKKVWIFNHYIIPPSIEIGHRHNKFAKYLVNDDYDVSLFLSSAIHNSDINLIKNNEKHVIEESEQGRYIALKTRNYNGNGIQRILNIFEFFFGLFEVTKKIEKKYGVPDIIYASSVHPLTCVAGILIAKRYKVKCIVEIRDLWPLTLVEMGRIKEKSIIAKMLYCGERWIYKRADSIIFTMEGGKNYIIDSGWDKTINLDKIYNINNGVDLEVFDYNKDNEIINDIDLNGSSFNVVYTGSIRSFNNIENIVNIAKILQEKGKYPDLKFLIYGDGTDKDRLIDICKRQKIDNVLFKGHVNKKYIPYILSKSKLNLLIYNEKIGLFKYGGSQNKLFEYLASGRPIVSNINMNFNILDKYKCGLSSVDSSPYELMQMIIKFYNIDENEYNEYCKNARQAAEDYDFKILTNKLEEVIKNTMRR